MSETEPGEKRSPRAAIFVIVGLVVIIVAIGMSIWNSRREEVATTGQQQAAPPAAQAPAQAPAAQAPAVQAPAVAQAPARPPAPAPAGAPGKASSKEKAAAAQPQAESKTPAAQAPPETRPSFDVVRVSREGRMVMAGRAAPGATVIITEGDKEVGRVKANDQGEWVFTPEQPVEPGSRELSLLAENPSGAAKTGEAPVILVVPEHEKIAKNEKIGKNDQIAKNDQTAANDALAIKVKPEGGVQLLQVPASSGSTGQVSVEVVNFDEHGHLSVAGRAPPSASVQVYLDNQPIASATADGKGAWNIAVVQPLAEGNHTVRADQLGSDGKVVARAEISFASSRHGPTSGQVTVAFGNSLWRIARRAYGSGFDYIIIYRANQDQIRNPDLIYPGQVFKLPVQD